MEPDLTAPIDLYAYVKSTLFDAANLLAFVCLHVY